VGGYFTQKESGIQYARWKLLALVPAARGSRAMSVVRSKSWRGYITQLTAPRERR